MPARLYIGQQVKNMIAASSPLLLQSSKHITTTASLVQSIPSTAPMAPLCTSSYSSSLLHNFTRSKISASIPTAAGNTSHHDGHLHNSRLLHQQQSTGFHGVSPAVAHVAHSGRPQHAALAAARYIRSCTAGAASSNSQRPSVGDLEAGLSSEAIGIDESTIDAIPPESMPAGAQRTEGPQPGVSPQPEVDPEAGDPQLDSDRPPSGPSGPDQAYEAGEPLAGKPRTSGPEVDDSPQEQRPEVQGPPGEVNPDRIPFWGS